MIKISYDFFYMSRMLKDKLCSKMYEYLYSDDNQEVERMEPCYNGIINNLYNLTYESTHIIDNIYLGNAYNASHYYNLVKNNIGLIINVTDEICNYYSDLDEFEYYNINIKDNNNNHILPYINDVLIKINNYNEINPGKNILIHCYMGSSRSASLTLAYLLKFHNMSIENGIKFIKDKRSLVNLNTTFLLDLDEWIKHK